MTEDRELGIQVVYRASAAPQLDDELPLLQYSAAQGGSWVLWYADPAGHGVDAHVIAGELDDVDQAAEAALEWLRLRELEGRPSEDVIRALETARWYLRGELDGIAEHKDAGEAVRHLAAALAEALPAAVAASSVLPAAATTRAYWDAYLTGDPEPDADDLDEALRRQEVTYMDPYLGPRDDPA